MLIPSTRLMVVAVPAASEVVLDAKATLPQGLWPNWPIAGRMDPAAAAECGAMLPLPPCPGGVGCVALPPNTTATLTAAAITTMTATIAVTNPACNRCSTSPAAFTSVSAPVSASNASCSPLRAAANPAPANTNVARAVSTIPRVPYGCSKVLAN